MNKAHQFFDWLEQEDYEDLVEIADGGLDPSDRKTLYQTYLLETEYELNGVKYNANYDIPEQSIERLQADLSTYKRASLPDEEVDLSQVAEVCAWPDDSK